MRNATGELIFLLVTNLKTKGYESLNRIQSIVQPTAMTSNENMLICGELSFQLGDTFLNLRLILGTA
jgi:hypothetical protein